METSNRQKTVSLTPVDYMSCLWDQESTISFPDVNADLPDRSYHR